MLTVSDLTLNDYCSRKLHLKKVLKLKEPENIALIKGIIIHDSVGAAIKGEPAGTALKNNIKKHHLKLKSFNQGLVDFYHESIPHIKNSIQHLDNTYDAEVQVQNNELLGRIDFMKDKIIELKTGNPPRENDVWPSHALQAAAYLWMSKKKEAIILYSKTGDTRTVLWNPFWERKLKKAIAETKESLAVLPPILDDKTRCEFCALRETCHDDKKMKELLS